MKRKILLTNILEEENKKIEEITPQRYDETSVSGSMPNPECDDDTLENAHDMGLYINADDEHPKPLGLGEEIDKAEEYQRTH